MENKLMPKQTLSENDITGVILAGGKGSRMYPLGETMPKCILPICNRPLMEYQIGMMRGVGITKIVIVIGYQGFKIVQQIGDGSRYGVHIEYVDQEQALGIAHAVGKLEPHIDTPFMLFLGDIFFVTSRLAELMDDFHSKNHSAVLATKIEESPEAIMRNFAIVEGKDGLVKRVMEKPRHTINKIKGCGLYMFGLEFFDAIRRTPRTAMRDEYEITDAIQILIDDGFRVKQLPVIDDDLNLTYPSDLLHLNLKLLSRDGRQNLVAVDADISQELTLNSVVAGGGVRLKGKGIIKNSVIFDDTELYVSGDIHNTIITPSNYLYCHDAGI